MDDLTEKIQSSQSKLESLARFIPGYKGYKQKEQRREADKLLRTLVAERYAEQARRLGDMQLALTTSGKLTAIVPLERAATKLQRLIDRIKTASYGYAGLMDAIKVDEVALDKLYDFDQAMLGGVERLAALLDKLSAAVDAEAPITAESKELSKELDALNNTFGRRHEVILAK
jgi:hypothetical protein